MIHAEEIEQAALLQIDLWGAVEGAMPEGYFENMGVCMDCLEGMAEVISEDCNLFPGTAFMRGFTLGLVLGREHP